ncbi:MAG TPA: phosphatase PAP2 family protein [Vicinamibacterales bacterium]|jgi:undecaprenyl-diphosphatase
METSILTSLAAHRSAPLDSIMLALTFIARGGAVWVVLAAARVVINRRLAMAAWQTVLAVLLAWVMSDCVLKPLVHRPRPWTSIEAFQAVGAQPAGYSFPSGHAATAAAGAYMLASTWPAARVGLWALAIGISCSRIYLGVHYPSDVLAGLLIGWAVAWVIRGRTVWRLAAAGSDV